MKNLYEVNGTKIGGTFPKPITQIYTARNKIEARELAKEKGIKITEINYVKTLNRKIDLRI